MANEKRLIDANELANFFGFMRKMWSGSEIMNVIHEAETVDAVEVVRCKDCKHYKPRKQSAYWKQTALCCARTAWINFPPDGFCSYGERRTDERKAD